MLGIVMAGLLLSGLTAFPLLHELEMLSRIFGLPETVCLEEETSLVQWLVHVRNGLRDTYGKYPFIAYGTDWLAYAHLLIAILFVGPLRDPVRNIWVINFGLIACVLVLPLALICGPVRGIPFFWRLIDCSFGVVGFLPLWFARKYSLELAALKNA